MPSLRELQRGFAAAVLDDAASIGGLGIVAAELNPGARIGIYRNNVLGNYRKAMAATYPVVRRLVGAEFFAAAIDAFVRVYPSTRGNVNRYGGEFARFLATYPPARELAYLPDVARVEWAIDQANIAADAAALDLAALAAVPEDALGKLRLALHPSVQLVASPYPVLRIWQANQPDHAGDERVDLAEGGDALLIARGAQRVTIERLDPGAHAFLLALARDLELQDAVEHALAVEAAFDLPAALKAHVAARIIVAFHAPPSPPRPS
jgi:hypothetical protein